jgi:hypothetical protein
MVACPRNQLIVSHLALDRIGEGMSAHYQGRRSPSHPLNAWDNLGQILSRERELVVTSGKLKSGNFRELPSNLLINIG